MVGEQVIQFLTHNYADFVLWERIYPEYLAARPGQSVLEIGSAPGQYLIRMKNVLGLEPYGVDYSELGVAQNREVFRTNGLAPSRVVRADAFSEAFVEEHEERFDIVISRGVIEHFTEHQQIIAAHQRVLKPGGRVVVSIPNYSGINYCLKWLFARDSLRAHNLDLMRLQAFSRLFEGHGLTALFCGYYGTIDLGMFETRHRSLTVTFQLCDKTQLVLNGLLRVLFGAGGPESRYCSPFLLYVGKK